MNSNQNTISNRINIIWTIASKDILDAIKNKVIISQIIAVTLILLSVKALSWAIQPPSMPIMVYDPGNSNFVQTLDASDDFNLQKAISLSEMLEVIGNMGYGLGPELGIVVPADFDLKFNSDGEVAVDGYISWANRNKARGLKEEIESSLEKLTGKSIAVNLDDHIVSPPAEIGLLGGLITIFAVTIILMMGVVLVPTLMLEEKQTRTMEALLVSPASINQVVIGKAIAGFFYILVTSTIVYGIYWTGVVHWGLAALFVSGAGLFSVGVGLLFGIVFKNQQDMTGWLSLTILIITGSIFVVLIGLDLPAWIAALVQWLPSVALAKIFWASFSTQAQLPQILSSMGIVIVFSGLLFGLIIWRLKLLDR